MMNKTGKPTSFYGQIELENLIDLAVKTYPERWKSRSNFINAAVCRVLRELFPQEMKRITTTQVGNVVGV